MTVYTDAWTEYVRDEAIPGTIATPLDLTARQSLAEAVIAEATLPDVPEAKSINVDSVRSAIHAAVLANGYALRDALIEDLRARLADHEARLEALE